MDDHESDLSHQGFSDVHPGAAGFVSDSIRQLRDYFEISEAELRRLGSSGILIGPPMCIKKPELSPQEVENVLAPLSNPWRLRILIMLSKDDDSLARLSNAFGLKKVHLQFHLNGLLESTYIEYNRKSHLYSITPPRDQSP